MHYFQGSREHRPPLGGLRNEDLIACSGLLSVISLYLYLYGGRNVLHMIYGYKRHTCNIGLVITHYCSY